MENFLAINHPHYGHISVSYYTDNCQLQVNRLVLKRKIVGEYLFTSVHTISSNSGYYGSEIDFEYDDYYCRNNYKYQYKMEFRYDYTEEGVEHSDLVHTATVNVDSFFDVLVVCDGVEAWYTPLNVSAVNPTTIRPYSMNTPLNAKKPSYFTNGVVNYEEGSCTGVFLKMAGPENNITFDTSYNWKYRKDFKNFITLGNAKVIKTVSGEVWLVGIKTDSITDTSLFDNAEIEGARQLEFGWFEVGEITNESDLYENGLINVPREYWNGV